jgi:transcriptional regulator with XRE-family HTH domain
MITPAQCRAARALLDWPRQWLASESGISTSSISDFERNAAGTPRNATLTALRRALEKAGIEFLDDGQGQGVRLKPPKAKG